MLSWNLFHGRSVPETRGSLFDEFAAALASWDWHVALLQEVPPWWPARLASEHRRALTSRNQLLPLSRLIAQWRPDLIKSWGGGANAILARDQEIREHRVRRLCLRPERRVVHAVRLESGLWVANVHASKSDDDPQRRDVHLARAVVEAWTGGGPVVFGGDFNVTAPPMDGWVHAARSHVDHVFAHGVHAAGPGTALDHGILSDHRPVLARISFP